MNNCIPLRTYAINIVEARDYIRELSEEVKIATNANEIESNLIVYGRVDNTHSVLNLQLDLLILLDGKVDGAKVRSLMDDVFNTNFCWQRDSRKRS